MANTWIEAAAIFGFDLALACPAGLPAGPSGAGMGRAKAPGRIILTDDPKAAVAGADVLNTDVWASMGQEAEQKEREQAFAGYCLDDALLALAKPDASCCTACPPIAARRLPTRSSKGKNSVVWDEAENRLHVQKAIMATLMGRSAAFRISALPCGNSLCDVALPRLRGFPWTP